LSHIILLGDSIFDNASYIPGGPAVIDHLRRILPHDWRATLLAVDGAVVSSVFRQLDRLPHDATHLVLSIGGNNALWSAGNLFSLRPESLREALQEVAAVREEFAAEYRDLLKELRKTGKPLAICTVYDAIPRLDAAEVAGLCVFNDTITRIAFAAGATLIDLRLICNGRSDYSTVSPIEPSAAGGGKIARAILSAVLGEAGASRVIAS
jgi:hypothetical protein